MWSLRGPSSVITKNESGSAELRIILIISLKFVSPPSLGGRVASCASCACPGLSLGSTSFCFGSAGLNRGTSFFPAPGLSLGEVFVVPTRCRFVGGAASHSSFWAEDFFSSAAALALYRAASSPVERVGAACSGYDLPPRPRPRPRLSPYPRPRPRYPPPPR